MSRGVVAGVETGRVAQQVADFHPLVVENLRGQVANVLADLRPVPDDVFAEDAGAAAGGENQPQQSADGGGLPRTVGADEAENLTFFHLEGDVDDAAGLSVELGQVVYLDDVHAGPPCRESEWS